mgnify:CR=1 FL=1
MTTIHELMKEANADFNVRYKPAGYESDYSGTHIPKTIKAGTERTLYKWIVREDTNETLGLVGGQYPEERSYKYLADIAEEYFPDTASSVKLLADGKRIAISQNIYEAQKVGTTAVLADDMIQPTLVWISSFDGSWATKAHNMMLRFFCTNQLGVGNSLFTVRHTKNHIPTLAERAKILEGHRAWVDTYTKQANELASIPFTTDEMNLFLKRLIPDPKPNPDRPYTYDIRAWRPVIEKRDGIMTKWKDELGHLEVGNKWLAYNAIQSFNQHEQGKGDRSEEKSLLRALDGKLGFSDKALKILTTIASPYI